jgi:hypothetical protein
MHPPQMGAGVAAVETDAPRDDELRPLLRLYFVTVHRELDADAANGEFGYLSFIHEVDFWERYEQGLVPEDLVLIMAANALRWACTIPC